MAYRGVRHMEMVTCVARGDGLQRGTSHGDGDLCRKGRWLTEGYVTWRR